MLVQWKPWKHLRPRKKKPKGFLISFYKFLCYSPYIMCGQWKSWEHLRQIKQTLKVFDFFFTVLILLLFFIIFL